MCSTEARPGTARHPCDRCWVGLGSSNREPGMDDALHAPRRCRTRGSFKRKEQPVVLLGELWGCYSRKRRSMEMGFSHAYFMALPAPKLTW